MRAVCLLVLVALLALGCRQDKKPEPTPPAPTLKPAATQQPEVTPSPTPPEPSNTPTPASTPTPEPICGRPAEAGSGVRTLVSGGVERTYRLYIPASYTGDELVPLVLNLHGYGSNAKEQERYADLIDDAESAGFLLVTPEATGQPRHWYVSGPAEQGYVDDFAFLHAVLDQLSRSLCVDSDAIYAAGISNGAFMAAQMACGPDRPFAAIALVAGASFPDNCSSSDPVPVLAFHGTSDFIVPFNGAFFGFQASISSVVERWAKHNGCSSSPGDTRVSEDVELLGYQDCRADVEFYVIDGGGHTWPGTSSPKPFLGRTTQTIDASAIIWDFFKRH